MTAHLDFVATPRSCEQLLQDILRMLGAHGGPACLIHVMVEARQDDGASGQRAMDLSSSRVAGMEPVEPAAITGYAGGGACNRRASSGAASDAAPPGRSGPVGKHCRQLIARQSQKIENGLAVARRVEPESSGNSSRIDLLDFESVDNSASDRARASNLLR